MKPLYKMMPDVNGLQDDSNWKFRQKHNSEIWYMKCFSLSFFFFLLFSPCHNSSSKITALGQRQKTF